MAATQASSPRPNRSEETGFTTLSCLIADAGDTTGDAGEESMGLPDRSAFEQYVTQSSLDRDPFTIALFDLMIPDRQRAAEARYRVGQALLQFAGIGMVVAYMGQDRFGLLANQVDELHQWLAPRAVAARSALLETAEADGSVDRIGGDDAGHAPPPLVPAPEDIEPTLVIGFASGLSDQVWRNAEEALTVAHSQPNKMVEYQSHRTSIAADNRQRRLGHRVTGAADTDRLVVLTMPIESVAAPKASEPWVRLQAGIANGDEHTTAQPEPTPISLPALDDGERRMIEYWLAGQIAGSVPAKETRVSIPATAEARRARSFAQRLFPLLERSRVAPSRVVLEIEQQAFVDEFRAVDPDGADDNDESHPVRRFARQAAAMEVAVAVIEFDGGWSSWQAIRDIPVTYLVPAAEIVRRAAIGDESAIRALVVLAADADDRDIELIMPAVATGFSATTLMQFGFTHRRSGSSTVQH